MGGVIVKLVYMSIQATVAVFAVLAARYVFTLFKVPKKFAYLLWLIPFIRLICPFAVESRFSIMPGFLSGTDRAYVSGSEDVEANHDNADMQIPDHTAVNETAITGQAKPEDGAGYVPVDTADDTANASGIADDNGVSGAYNADTSDGSSVWKTLIDRMRNSQVPVSDRAADIAAIVWLTGVVLLLSYSTFAYVKLRKKLVGRVLAEGNVYFADYIDTAFVIGVLKPYICIPSNIGQSDMEYVILHEKCHIKRGDYLVKLLLFLITVLHWFNPFVWLAYVLMGKDMEMSCDEAVIQKIGADKRKDYAHTLLALSSGKRAAFGIPLAFGEGSTKSRIKNIMKYKKPVIFAAVLAVAVIVGLTAGLLTNPNRGDNNAGSEDADTEELNGATTEMDADAEELNGITTEMDAEPYLEQTLFEEYPDAVEIYTEDSALDKETGLGADGAILDYADMNLIVFHGYMGLYVYDRSLAAITDDINLEAIGCNYTQGDNACVVEVGSNGYRIYLTPMAGDTAYVYDVHDKVLVQVAKRDIENAEKGRPEYTTAECIGEDSASFRSYECEKIADGDTEYYGYLLGGELDETGLWYNLLYAEKGENCDILIPLLADYLDMKEQIEDDIDDVEQKIQEAEDELESERKREEDVKADMEAEQKRAEDMKADMEAEQKKEEDVKADMNTD